MTLLAAARVSPDFTTYIESRTSSVKLPNSRQCTLRLTCASSVEPNHSLQFIHAVSGPWSAVRGQRSEWTQQGGQTSHESLMYDRPTSCEARGRSSGNMKGKERARMHA
jgi:hypothetical protein